MSEFKPEIQPFINAEFDAKNSIINALNTVKKLIRRVCRSCGIKTHSENLSNLVDDIILDLGYETTDDEPYTNIPENYKEWIENVNDALTTSKILYKAIKYVYNDHLLNLTFEHFYIELKKYKMRLIANSKPVDTRI